VAWARGGVALCNSGLPGVARPAGSAHSALARLAMQVPQPSRRITCRLPGAGESPADAVGYHQAEAVTATVAASAAAERGRHWPQGNGS